LYAMWRGWSNGRSAELVGGNFGPTLFSVEQK
jgi:hypothetical protein